jgi:hypothetical protein
VIQVPLIYIPQPNYHVPLVKFEEIDIRGFYVNKVYEVTWNHNEKILLQPSEESGGGSVGGNNGLLITDNHNFDSSKLGMDYDFNVDRTQHYDTLGQSHHRRKRSLAQQQSDTNDDNVYRVYNQYTKEVNEYSASYRVSTDKEDPTLLNLPKNRTIVVDCSSPEETDECVEAQFIIHNFRPGSEPITINMNFSLDLSQIGECLHMSLNFFILSFLNSIPYLFVRTRTVCFCVSYGHNKLNL